MHGNMVIKICVPRVLNSTTNTTTIMLLVARATCCITRLAMFLHILKSEFAHAEIPEKIIHQHEMCNN